MIDALAGAGDDGGLVPGRIIAALSTPRAAVSGPNRRRPRDQSAEDASVPRKRSTTRTGRPRWDWPADAAEDLVAKHGGGSICQLLDGGLQANDAELLHPGGAARLGDSVGVEDDEIVGLQAVGGVFQDDRDLGLDPQPDAAGGDALAAAGAGAPHQDVLVRAGDHEAAVGEEAEQRQRGEVVRRSLTRTFS